MLTQLFHVHALSALHVGVGQAVGTVDLPIARSKATHLPLVPGSAIKGVLRDEFSDAPVDVATRLFGPAKISGADEAHAGALAFGDAHLLLFPVRSLAGVMALATCPFVLTRYAADLACAGIGSIPEVPKVAAGAALVTDTSVLEAIKGKLVLDDLDLDHAGAGAKQWAKKIGDLLYAGDPEWQQLLLNHLAIISDDDFSFLAETSTEVRARIRIDDSTGVVARGALWYEENLPAESVLWGLVGIDRSRARGEALTTDAIKRQFNDGMIGSPLLQIGGKATVGRGLVRFVLQRENVA